MIFNEEKATKKELIIETFKYLEKNKEYTMRALSTEILNKYLNKEKKEETINEVLKNKWVNYDGSFSKFQTKLIGELSKLFTDKVEKEYNIFRYKNEKNMYVVVQREKKIKNEEVNKSQIIEKEKVSIKENNKECFITKKNNQGSYIL